MDCVRIDRQADFTADRLVVGGLDHPFEAADIHNHFKMDTLEGDARHHAGQHPLFRGDDIHILRADDRVYRLIFLEALIKALEPVPGKLCEIILPHDSIQNIALADEIRHECVLRLVVDILRRTDLLDDAAVHHDDGVRHGQRLLLIVGYIDKGNAHALLDIFQLHLHILAQFEIERTKRLI